MGKKLRPMLANGTLVGVFVGDELVCTGVPLSNFSALVKQVCGNIPYKCSLIGCYRRLH
jgi:hypothetical protein